MFRVLLSWSRVSGSRFWFCCSDFRDFGFIVQSSEVSVELLRVPRFQYHCSEFRGFGFIVQSFAHRDPGLGGPDYDELVKRPADDALPVQREGNGCDQARVPLHTAPRQPSHHTKGYREHWIPFFGVYREMITSPRTSEADGSTQPSKCFGTNTP